MTHQDETTTNKSPPDENFAARIKELRQRRGLTQEELAVLSGLASDTIRRLEYASFNPSLGTLKKLADGLGITTLALLDENFDKVDELAMFIRRLPEPHQRIAFAVVLTLQHDVLSSS
jgi:transcriptional regulator with XRE-family HTH domain